MMPGLVLMLGMCCWGFPFHQRMNENTGGSRSDFDFKFSEFRVLI